MKFVQDHKNWDEVEAKGLVDGGLITLKCSNCSVPLVKVLISQPDIEYEQKLVAKCCWCGDKSFSKTVKGGVYFGHTDYCHFVDFIEENSMTIIQTNKGDKVWSKK